MGGCYTGPGPGTGTGTGTLITATLMILSLSPFPTAHTLKFQESNLNSGRARLILYQGKTRHEIVGRSCPLGIAFIKPQLFSCACVTGVWAFYDIMCAAPLKIVGGVNHCFRMPLETYIQQIMLVSSPTRAHGDTVTLFDGDLEVVTKKFFRETHVLTPAPNQAMTIGPAWTLTSPNGSQQVCLDSSKHDVYEEAFDHQSPSITTAFCHFSNVSRSISHVGLVSVGCRKRAQKIEPDNCYPFLEKNGKFDHSPSISSVKSHSVAGEEMCTDVALLEAYEEAMEQDKNDLINQNKTTRDFKRLLKHGKRKSSLTPTTPTPNTQKSPQDLHANGEPRLGPLPTMNGHGLTSNSLNDLFPDDFSQDSEGSDSQKTESGTKLERQRTQIPSSILSNSSKSSFFDPSNLNNYSPNLKNLNETHPLISSSGMDIDIDVDINVLGDGDDVPAERKIRDSANVNVSREHAPEEMETIYKVTLKNESSFLEVGGVGGERALLTHVWTYQHDKIKSALKLKSNGTKTGKSTIHKLLESARDIMTHQCEAIPNGFLNLALNTFIKIQEEQVRWETPYTGNVDEVQDILRRCLESGKPYDFGSSSQSACAKEYPTHVTVGTERKELLIPEHYKSKGYEPLIEAVWKMTVHALVYCNQPLSTDVPAHSKLSINFHRIFTNQIHRIWVRENGSASAEGVVDVPEYGGVIGDTALIMRDIDICTTAASLTLDPPIRLHYTRPPFKPPPGWLPTDPGDYDDYPLNPPGAQVTNGSVGSGGSAGSLGSDGSPGSLGSGGSPGSGGSAGSLGSGGSLGSAGSPRSAGLGDVPSNRTMQTSLPRNIPLQPPQTLNQIKIENETKPTDPTDLQNSEINSQQKPKTNSSTPPPYLSLTVNPSLSTTSSPSSTTQDNANLKKEANVEIEILVTKTSTSTSTSTNPSLTASPTKLVLATVTVPKNEAETTTASASMQPKPSPMLTVGVGPSAEETTQTTILEGPLSTTTTTTTTAPAPDTSTSTTAAVSARNRMQNETETETKASFKKPNNSKVELNSVEETGSGSASSSVETSEESESAATERKLLGSEGKVTNSAAALEGPGPGPVQVMKVGHRNRNRKRREVSTRRKRFELEPKSDYEKREEIWRRERTILDIAYCLKKFDEPKVHLGQDCD